MKKHVLFIHGGAGPEDYSQDAKLVDSLRHFLGDTYAIHYPLLVSDSTPDFGRVTQISKEISLIDDAIILVGHSLGASMLLKFLSEKNLQKKIAGVFLIATPFWRGDEDWKAGFKLQENFADKLSADYPIFLYHCMDDEVVSFEHLSIYSKELPRAAVREIKSGGHSLNNDLAIVADDIKSLDQPAASETISF